MLTSFRFTGRRSLLKSRRRQEAFNRLAFERLEGRKLLAGASDDNFSVSPGGLLRGNVLLNDTAAAPFVVTLAPTVLKGAVSLQSNGSFDYQANPLFFGTENFLYSINDANGIVSNASVSIDVAVQPAFSASLVTEHVDIGLAFENGQWEPHIHDETNDEEYETDQAVLYAGSAALTTQPAGAAFAFTGAPAGSSLYVLPQNNNPAALFLGVGTEEIAVGTFQGGAIKLQLKSVNGPGHFSVWQSTLTGPSVAMATANGITAADFIQATENSHAHFNWAFTQRGRYDVTFEASAVLPGGAATSSGDVTYYFDVQSDSVAPTAIYLPDHVFVASTDPHAMDVIYSDNQGVGIGSLGTGDIRVTGPNGFDSLASFGKIVSDSHGRVVHARYVLSAPGGFWDSGDNGVYSVSLQSSQVGDTSLPPNFANLGSIGTFVVAVGAARNWGSDVSGNWSVAANWENGNAPAAGGAVGEIVRFDNLTPGGFTSTNDRGNPFILNGIALDSRYGNIAFSAPPVGVMVAGQQLVAISNGATGPFIQQDGSATVASSIPIILTTPFSLQGSGHGHVVLSGALSGLGGVAFNGTGEGLTIVGGANTFAGGTILNDGHLALDIGSALGLGNLTVNGGDLRFNSFVSPNGMVVSNSVVANSDLVITGNNSGVLSGGVSGAGGIALLANSGITLRLTGVNTYTGPTYVATTTSGSGFSTIALEGPSGTSLRSSVILVDRFNNITLDNRNSANNAAGGNNNDRLNDLAQVSLQSRAGFNFFSNESVLSTERLGELGVSGSPSVTINSGVVATNRSGVLRFLEYSPDAPSVTLGRGINLGAAAPGTLGNDSLVFGNSGDLLASLRGGSGIAGTTNISILPSLFGHFNNGVSSSTWFGNGNSLATYGAANGVRPLNTATEYATSIVSGTTTDANIRLVQPLTSINGATSINSLVLDRVDATNYGRVSGTGTLTVASGLVLSAGASGNATITSTARNSIDVGTLDFGANEAIIISPEVLTISSQIVGSGGLHKASGRDLALTAVNSYTGPVTISGGSISVGSATSNLGGSGVVHLNGGSLQVTGATQTFSRGLALDDGHGFVDITTAGTTFTASGAISGSGNLNKLGAGTLELAAGNSYSGDTVLSAGVLSANDATAFGTSSTFILSPGATLRATAAMTLGQEIVLAAGGGVRAIQTDADVVLNGAIGHNGSSTNALPLTKTGAGKLVINSVDNSFNGELFVSAGTTLVNGTLPAMNKAGFGVIVSAGATLGGTGTIERDVQVQSTGTLSPGLSPGRLSTGSVQIAAGGVLKIEVNGPAPSTNFDVLNVTGSVDITNAVLSLSASGVLVAGTSVTIVRNDGTDPVVGRFTGLSEGASVVAGQSGFHISYVGGDGNDIVLVANTAPDSQNDLFLVTPGNTVRGNVLFNDSDLNGDSLSSQLLAGPTQGTVVLNIDGSFTYTPGSAFGGADSFTYTAADGAAGTDTATVTIRLANSHSMDVTLSTEHVDVGLAFEDAAWDLHVHDETNDVEYAPDEVLLHVGADAILIRPADEVFAFTGVASGAKIYVLPQVENEDLLYLGVGAEEIVTGTFQGNLAQLKLKAVNGPGHFSMWQSGLAGPVVAVATSNGITAGDSFTVLAGGHAHYNWGFAAPGTYEVTFEATAVLPNGTAISSGDVTYFFTVNSDAVAADDSYSVNEDSTLTVPAATGLLANDVDPDGQTLKPALVKSPANGKVTVNPDGSFSYIPNPNFSGTDTFTYAVTDVRYRLVPLGTLGGNSSFARDVNNERQVTGNSSITANASNPLQGYRWQNGVMTGLGVVPGTGSNNFSRGFALNDSGIVVGESDNNVSKAFRWENGSIVNIGTLGGSSAVAHGISSLGQIVGSSSNGTVSKPFIRENGVMVPLPTLAGTAASTGRAWSISPDGRYIAGLSRVTDVPSLTHATLWERQANGSYRAIDLDALADQDNFSQAYSVNNSGTVVGSSVVGKVSPTSTTDLYHGFYSIEDELVDIGILNNRPTWRHSEAKDVNQEGAFVGYVANFFNSPTFGGAAILGDRVGDLTGIVELNELVANGAGWQLQSAEGLNNGRDIVGFGTVSVNGTNRTRAFMLVPEIIDYNGSVFSNVATVTITVNGVPDAPVALNDTYSVDRGRSVFGNVLLNDFDADMDAVAGTGLGLYSVTDLGNLGATSDGPFFPRYINDSNQVVGVSPTATAGQYLAYSSLNGAAMTSIGGLGGNSVAFAVNNAGVIVGQSENAGITTATRWVNGVPTAVAGLAGPNNSSGGINSSGQVAGWMDAATGGAVAYRLTGNTLENFGNLGGPVTDINGMNSSGRFAGNSETAGGGFGSFRAFVSSPSTNSLINLGLLNPSHTASLAFGINDSGTVIGSSNFFSISPFSFTSQGFMWKNGVMTEIPRPAGYELLTPSGINNSNMVVGSITPDAFSSESEGWLYDGRKLHLLTDHLDPTYLGWQIANGWEINDKGFIAAEAVDVGGSTRNVLLSPVKLQATLVTSPAHGTVALNANGSFTYVPGPSFTGADSFTYSISDGLLTSNIATVNFTLPVPVSFQTTLTNQHVDIGLALEGHDHGDDDGHNHGGHEAPEWDLHIHDETNDVEYAPDKALLYVGSAGITVRAGAAAGSAFDFLGVPVGGTFYVLPQNENPDLLFLGIGAEELEPADFVSGTVNLKLISVTGPGHFSMWQSTIAGPSLAVATADGITSEDAIAVEPGTHQHFNYAFSKPGYYSVTVQASGVLTDDGQVLNSDDKTYYFQVGNVVRQVDVQNGLDQRSFVRNIDLAFENEDGLFDLLRTNRIQLTKFDLNGENGVAMPRQTMGVIGNSIRLDFGAQGLGGNRNSNAGDGYYRIGIDTDGDGQLDAFRHFYRLLGDVTGDRKVDDLDRLFILDNVGSNNPNGDANGDRAVNAIDSLLATRAFGRRLKDGLPLDD